jgi:PKD repeat protein
LSGLTVILVPAPNDSICQSIQLIVDAAPISTGNIFATPDASPASPLCFTDTGIDNDVWFRFVAPNPGDVQINTFFTGSSSAGAQLALYSSSNNGCTGVLTEIGCDEFGGFPATINAAGLTPGNTYFVRADGFFGDMGAFDIEVRTPPVPCVLTIPPGAIAESENCGANDNDGCYLSIPSYEDIQCGETYHGSTFFDGFSFLFDSDWYRFNVNSTDVVQITGELQFEGYIILAEISDCNSPQLVNFALASPCSTVTLNNSLPPGVYAIVVEPDWSVDILCGSFNEYWVRYEIGSAVSNPVVTPQTPLCVNATPVNLTATPSGGNWVGSGITSASLGTFDPAAAGAGTHEIIYFGPANSNGCAGSDTIDIQVDPLPTPLFSFGISGGTVTFTNLSADATSYSWNFGDGGNSTAAAPVYTYTANGTYTVVLSATNLCGTTTASQQITINSIGIDPSWVANFRLFPNPADDVFHIEITSNRILHAQVRVLDLQGRVAIPSSAVELTTGQQTISYQTGSLAAGTYLVEIYSNEGFVFRKLVVR